MEIVRTWLARNLLCAVLFGGMALALGGCAQSMSEFAQSAAPGAPKTGQLMMEPTSTPTIGNGVARPAVLVEETTVPAPKRATGGAPPLPEPTATTAYSQPSSAGGNYPNMNVVPDQPKGKLLTTEEKAKIIAELEALARRQGAAVPKAKKPANCATENAKPADRIKGETAGAEC
ncbi:hypothetical protein BH10PSE9_BH10PSE9_17360 [soil metagenome]